MAIVPVFCAEDSDGPVSKEEALHLLRLMHQRAIDRWGENSNAALKGDRSAFDHASGAEQALSWAIDLVGRTVLDPASSQEALVSSAVKLERMAKHLRQLAGEPR